MESFAGTLVFASLALALAFALGYGPVALLLPEKHADLRWAAMPTVGYVTYCLLVMVISGNLFLTVGQATWPALATLLLLSLVAFVRRRRDAPARLLWRAGLLVLAPTLVLITGPALLQSAELYLASANLDFYQSLIFQEILRRENLSVFGHFAAPTATHSIELSSKIWPDTPQARFGGVMFSYLLQSLSGLPAKSSLTTATIVFAACVPLSFYFFSRTVLGMPARTAAVAAILAGIASPLALSFLYILVGQGSGMPVLPLLISVVFLALREPSWRLVALAALLVAGLFWLYAMMLPFALTPMGLVAFYLMARRRLSLAWAFAILGGVVLGMLLAWSGMLGDLAAFFKGLAQVSGRLVGTVFFVDFLTEMFFVYLLGVTTYPASNSILSGTVYQLLGDRWAWRVVVACTAFVLAAFVAYYVRWMRDQRDDARRVAVVSLVLVYGAVWLYFTFVSPYGYSAFKMTAWLQFMVVPMIAFGLARAWERRHEPRGRAGRAARAFLLAGGVFYVGANVVASADYAGMSFGTNRDRGYVVNAFGLTDNPDVVRVGRDVAGKVAPTHSVGLSFTDAVQNQWAAYRLTHRMPHSIVSHESLPEDDAFLPDPLSGEVRDTSGELKRAKDVRFDDVWNDFYLLPGDGNLNPEITVQALPPPVWANQTFRLQEGRALRDYLFLGRGFYRAEFPRDANPWWQPGPSSRWSPDGGEFYLLQARHPGQPYRLKLTAMVGFGIPNGSRTLDLYHGKTKFDEIRIDSTARVISKPFVANGRLDKVTVVVREKTQPITRRAGLWRMGSPDDTRKLNIQVSGAQVLAPDHRPEPSLDGKKVEGNAILDRAYTFNGITADLWVGARGSLAFVAPFAASHARVEVEVPGWRGFSFPYKFSVRVAGEEHGFEAAAPGRLVLDVPLARAQRGDVVELELRPSQAREVDDPFTRRNRPTSQSVLLRSMQFSPRP